MTDVADRIRLREIEEQATVAIKTAEQCPYDPRFNVSHVHERVDDRRVVSMPVRDVLWLIDRLKKEME